MARSRFMFSVRRTGEPGPTIELPPDVAGPGMERRAGINSASKLSAGQTIPTYVYAPPRYHRSRLDYE